MVTIRERTHHGDQYNKGERYQYNKTSKLDKKRSNARRVVIGRFLTAGPPIGDVLAAKALSLAPLLKKIEQYEKESNAFKLCV